MRQCVGCREMKAKRELIRVIKTSDNQVLVDATGKKNGRGAYLCPRRECLEKAVKNKGLERSFKMNIQSGIYDALEKEFEKLENRCSFPIACPRLTFVP